MEHGPQPRSGPLTNGIVSNSSHDQGPEYLQRLFVGWVPKHYTEKDLTPFFSRYGTVRDCIILKDKVTGQPRGAAFVSYGTREEAETAIQGLNRQVHLPGALQPLEVRFAKNNQFVQASEGPADNRQLFFSNAPRSLGEGELVSLFSSYGCVEEVNLFRDRKAGASKGSGFVTMATREQAVNVLQLLGSLDTQRVGSAGAAPSSSSPAAGLQVKWADPDLQHKKKVAVEKNNADNRMLFFARTPRSASEEEVKAVFSHYGTVYDVILFRAFQGAPTTRGCGLVTMGSHAEAAAALGGLDSKFIWSGMGLPMSVRWMDAALQKRRRDAHVAAIRHDLLPPVRLTAAALPPSQNHATLLPASLQQGPTLGGVLHSRGFSAPLAGLHWLHQPETQLSLGLVGAAGYAALSAPVLPGAREQEVVTALHSGGLSLPSQTIRLALHGEGASMSSQLGRQPAVHGALAQQQMVWVTPQGFMM